MADYNSNGSVDDDAYVIWRKTDGTPAGYNTWRANFGRTTGSGSIASTNPTILEPTTRVLLMFATAG